MSLAAFQIAPERLWSLAPPVVAPLALLDLDSDQTWPDDFALPACPLIGLGSRDHPRACLMDAVVEPPISLRAIIAQVVGQPLAAETFVALMRLHAGCGISPGVACEAESLAYGVLQGSAAHRQWIDANSGREAQATGSVVVNRADDRLIVTLDRAEAGNAIDRAMRDDLHDMFVLAANDPEITRIELRAAGRCFSLGADLAEFGTTRDPAAAHAIRRRTLPARALLRFRGLIDVAVQGACIGSGLELAAFGTWIKATNDAWFQLPELAMGIIPGAGGCISIPQRIGRQRTALMVLSGRRISARVALDWGLIDAIVDDLPSGDGQADHARIEPQSDVLPRQGQ